MLVFEFVIGGTLHELLVQSRYYEEENPDNMKSRLDSEQLLRFMYGITCALEYLAFRQVFTYLFNASFTEQFNSNFIFQCGFVSRVEYTEPKFYSIQLNLEFCFVFIWFSFTSRLS